MPPAEPCTDPLTCEVVDALRVNWRCEEPGCSYEDWRAFAVVWPSWAAHSTNLRAEVRARRTFDEAGVEVYPYMGVWSDGCEVTSVSGVALIIEWERGTDEWRETLLAPGETHVIDLVGRENSAMIETIDDSTALQVTLQNCVPQPVS
jgi:hypothetical protein